jgi:DNA-binding response OmpR family regulator
MAKNLGESAYGPGRIPPPKKLRILIADDDRDAVLTLMTLLRDEGHEVLGVYKGRQALDTVASFDPDVVVLDIAMPELSGWEVARAIKGRYRKHPLIVGISGEYKSRSDAILSEIIGFDHYLTKPYAIADLVALIDPLRFPQAPDAA